MRLQPNGADLPVITAPREIEVMDEFQLTTIIAKAISACATETDRGERLQMTSEQATCVAKAVITTLSEAGLAIARATSAASP